MSKENLSKLAAAIEQAASDPKGDAIGNAVINALRPVLSDPAVLAAHLAMLVVYFEANHPGLEEFDEILSMVRMSRNPAVFYGFAGPRGKA